MDPDVQRGPTSAEAAKPTPSADRGAVKAPTCETLKPEAASSPGENEAPGDVPQEGHVNPKPGQGDEEDEVFKGMKNISVWTYLYTELTRGYWLEHDEAKFSEKRKRVYTFMQIPKELEKFMFYGFFQCVDGFLYLYTLLPLRFIVALIKLVVKGFFSSCWPIPGRMLDPAQICDLLKGIILVACFFLLEYVDVSMMYHLIRGQAIIKLYIFFNMLEVADRLFSSLGQDILDSLFWTATEPRGRRREHFGTIPHLGFAILYVFLHAILVLFQATTLNVAFNSHNKALLTIMMSNNFVELKGSVFKKFEKNNLFQMSCSDVRERFHFMVLLMIVSIRNLTEFSWNMDHFWVLVPDIILMLIAEFIVDWVKHAFITKFNEIPSEVYKEYTVSIAYDVANSRQKHAFSDHVDVVSRRMGFIPIPVAVLLLRVVYQSIKIEGFQTYTLIALFYLCLFTLKVLISIVLLGKTCDLVKDNKLSKEAAAKTPPKSSAAPPAAGEKHSLMTRSMTVVELSSKSAIEEVKTAAGLHRRSRSVGRDLNVTFSNTSSFSDVSMADTSVTSPLNTDISMTKPMFSNSTVSLQSVGLNEEFIKDKDKVTGGHVSPTLTDMELKQRKPEREKEPPKPLSEVDRYTMCSNRII